MQGPAGEEYFSTMLPVMNYTSSPPMHGLSTFLVSIIVPIYNSQRTLLRTLNSLARIGIENRVLAQIILIDDGSTDDSVAIAEKFLAGGQFSTAQIIRQPNGGTGAARNTGLAQATGEWIFFLDSDDQLKFDPVRHAIGVEQSVTCLGFTIFIKKGMWKFRWDAQLLQRHNRLDTMTAKCPYFPPNLLIRRSAIDRPFDTKFRTLEDWHWFTINPRIFENMRVINGIISATVHVHGGNKSAQFTQRGHDRIAIASELLNELHPQLTKRNQSNLLMQADIGRVQTGEKVAWSALGRWPCDLSLLVKGVIYFVFKRKLAEIEPYQRK